VSIAILGAGILGTCTALELADRGHRLTVFERNAEPLSEASLYNEGKPHLGFVYAADRSFRTAERMIRGAGRFMDVLGRWIPHAALRGLPSRPFDYVVHRDTMVTVPDVEVHFSRVRQTIDRVLPRRPVVSPQSTHAMSLSRTVLQHLGDGGDGVPVACGDWDSKEPIDPAEVADDLHVAPVHAEEEPAFPREDLQ
jgi:hypothetical protein